MSTMSARALLLCTLVLLLRSLDFSFGFTHHRCVFLTLLQRVQFMHQRATTSWPSSSSSAITTTTTCVFLSTNSDEGNTTKKATSSISPVAESLLLQEKDSTAEQEEPVSSSSPSSSTSRHHSYRFGDVTRSFLQRTTSRVNKLTGKEEYEFGDLSRWLDQQAKGKINEITGRGGNGEYMFGDLTRWADQQAKEMVSNYTGKESYQVGDISKEVVRRTMSGEYELQDVLLALRVLLSAGISLSPIATALPIKVVMELINLGLAQEVGGKVMDVLGKSLDERFKLALTGDSQYRLGDISKRELMKSLSTFTGKSDYTFGDISKRIADLAEKGNKNKVDELKMDSEQVRKDLAWWDKRFQEQSGLK